MDAGVTPGRALRSLGMLGTEPGLAVWRESAVSTVLSLTLKGLFLDLGPHLTVFGAWGPFWEQAPSGTIFLPFIAVFREVTKMSLSV